MADAQPTRSSHHHAPVIERGRSRDVSSAAIARKASEERRMRARAARILSVQPVYNRATSPVAAVSARLASSPDSTSIQPPPHAEPSSTSLPTCDYPSPEPSTCHSRSPSPPCEEQEEVNPVVNVHDKLGLLNPTLREEMQEAYTACQFACGSELTASRLHRCPHIHRARVLCLKTLGIEVTSDKDPRINAVRDEDFVFVPPEALVLDEETQAAFQAERARQEEEALAYQQHEREEAEKRRIEAEKRRIEAEKRRMQEARRRLFAHIPKKLELREKKTRPTTHITTTPTTFEPLPTRMLKRSQELIAKPESSPEPALSMPGPVSSREVFFSMRGPLFPQSNESGIREHQRRTSAQARLLDSLLVPPVHEPSVLACSSQQPITHSCHPSRRAQRTPDRDTLYNSPLCLSEAGQSEVDSTESSATEKKSKPVSVFDFVMLTLQSCSVQFSATIPDTSMAAHDTSVEEQPALGCKLGVRKLQQWTPLNEARPGGRALFNNIQRFAPQLKPIPFRDLNFASETNIPLGNPHQKRRDKTSLKPAPPRPRSSVTQPEWRLRYISNPYQLRLKALANVLGSAGIAWEGRMHPGMKGSGCGRLKGVAFEGLGGSRLAFESK